jgi:hypothetical protein
MARTVPHRDTDRIGDEGAFIAARHGQDSGLDLHVDQIRFKGELLDQLASCATRYQSAASRLGSTLLILGKFPGICSEISHAQIATSAQGAFPRHPLQKPRASPSRHIGCFSPCERRKLASHMPHADAAKTTQ